VGKELLIWMIFGPLTYRQNLGYKSISIKIRPSLVREDFILQPKLEINSTLLQVAMQNTGVYAMFIR
jgi:hypothetical protein